MQPVTLMQIQPKSHDHVKHKKKINSKWKQLFDGRVVRINSLFRDYRKNIHSYIILCKENKKTEFLEYLEGLANCFVYVYS